MRKKLLITIDGPAGAGKSSASKALSQKLSYHYLDTGALYRAIALKIIKEKMDPTDVSSMICLSKNLDLHLETMSGRVKVILDNVDITGELRTEEIGFLASKVSAISIIRALLMPIQQKIGELGGVVAEGRDMGTVVFPHADLKFFLNATAFERARRRQKELVESGIPSEFEVIKAKIVLRDRQDMERSLSPLKVPLNAIVIDSTALTLEEVVDLMMSAINSMML